MLRDDVARCGRAAEATFWGDPYEVEVPDATSLWTGGAGPCVVTQRDSTILVLPDQHAIVDRGGVIRIRAKE